MHNIYEYDAEKIHLIATISEKLLSADIFPFTVEYTYALFDCAVADFNKDDVDEILLAGFETETDTSWNIFTSVYEIDAISNVINSRIKKTYYPARI